MSVEYDRVVTSTAWSPGPGCHGGCGVKIYVNLLKKLEYRINIKFWEGCK